MRTYYIIFNADNSVNNSLNKDFDPKEYSYIKTRVSDLGTLEYYAHNSIAEFYKKSFSESERM